MTINDERLRIVSNRHANPCFNIYQFSTIIPRKIIDWGRIAVTILVKEIKRKVTNVCRNEEKTFISAKMADGKADILPVDTQTGEQSTRRYMERVIARSSLSWRSEKEKG